ncbi:uncharacterized protein BX664DRAFT_263824 [Halteromyces radiatus]|uniref:uncharacterized protein n=1 Tax=Halteromyces radiatus TaxID=101107 RepID=UPI0022210562|nr:uncharacterized protein BX664DRAFT_263824 [Halteromyces radiatus]KAI8089260.1 hypothetical protein BX664DRAFT_263824 [Halteromyces radiatus]
MFSPPSKTLKQALTTVLNSAQEYSGDVCFVFGNERIWAHKALLIARVPEEFRNKAMPQLLVDTTNEPIMITTISTLVPYNLFIHLLQFWYTSDFYFIHPQDSSMDPLTHDTALLNIRQSITALEKTLQLTLLPLAADGLSDEDQLVADLTNMRRNQLDCDVMVNIFKPNVTRKKQTPTVSPIPAKPPITTTTTITTKPRSDPITTSVPLMISFPVHQFILASRSSYFHSLLYGQVCEASHSTVLLPYDLFSSTTLDIILHYFYTDQLQVPDLPLCTSMSAFQNEMNRKKHVLRELQKVFRAADYLGHIDSLCNAALYEMQSICHGFKCTCSSCVILLPSMLAFADKHQSQVGQLRSKLLTLYTEPIQALPPLWSQKPFSLLISASSSASSSTSTSPVLNNSSLPTKSSSSSSSSLLVDMVSMTLINITKRNAIHVLHSVHLCLSKIRSADPFPTWSQPSLALIHAILHHTVSMVSLNFDYYCVEYPILLSCVDGIGGAFSVDFLDFLLKRILNNGIQDSNAAVLYQGIVRDLIGRQEVVKNVAVDGVLLEARQQCIDYLSHRWIGVKAQGGFQNIDKETLRMMADDINIPYRTLSKPIESEFSAMFSFKPKSSTKQKSIDGEGIGKQGKGIPPVMANNNNSVDMTTTSSAAIKSRRRLSLSSLRTSLTDVLLPVDVSPSTILPTTTSSPNSPRKSRLTFELPETPIRAKFATTQVSTTKSSSRRRRRTRSPKHKYRWGLGGSKDSASDSDEEDDSQAGMPIVGAKVELLRRPLPTLGRIKFIGNVQFSKGTWVGVELESRLGQNDGSVDGIRYFQTDPQRGIFVKPDGLKLIPSPSKS